MFQLHLLVLSCLMCYNTLLLTVPLLAAAATSPTHAPVASGLHNWVTDVLFLSSDVKYLDRDLPSLDTWLVNIYLSNNGPSGVYQRDDGHVRLTVSVNITNSTNLQDIYVGTTNCLKIGSHVTEVNSLIEATTLHNQVNESVYYLMSDIFNVTTKKYKRSDTTKQTYNTTYSVSFSSDIAADLQASISTVGCSRVRTIGRWNDPNRWRPNTVPVNTDTAYFPANTGVVILENDVTVKTIYMDDGLLYSYKTGCPDGWSIDPVGGTVRKCYKLFTNSSSFQDAESTCENSGQGSIDAHLVEISDYNELKAVRGLCRGAADDPVANEGCWIGLSDKFGNGHYDWIEPNSLLRTSFRNWRRPEWNNKTVSGGVQTPGELCVHIVGWREDPLIEEQGTWNDIACASKKPFICQTFAKTSRYQITATDADISNGAMEGGILSLSQASSINNFNVLRSASLKLSGGLNRVSSIILTDGSTLSVLSPASVQFDSASVIGEPSYPTGLQPQFIATGSIRTVSSSGSPYQVQINARSEVSSTVTIESNSNLILNQGGDVSTATVNTVSSTSSFTLGGYAAKLASYDAFDISLSHRGQVVGEFLNSTEPWLLENSKRVGVYRLSVVGTGAYQNEAVTKCIDYHASAAELKTTLEELRYIQNRGGVTVRRYGDGADPLFNFGYTHRVEIDAPTTANYAEGPLTVSVKCIGIANCYCARTKVAMQDATGQMMCPLGTDSSGVESSKCVIDPTIAITRVSTLSYTNTQGSGQIILSGESIDYHPLATS